MASSMSTMTSGFCGIGMPNDGTGVGSRGVDLQRVPGPNPRVVAAVEHADVSDTAVVQDQSGARGRDLPGPPSRPLLVGVAFRVPAVEDDRRVMRDPEPAQGCVQLIRGAAIPAHRVLEQVRVEIQRLGKMVLLVLLGNPEIDVEEQEAACRSGFRALTREELCEPFGMDEPLVVRETLDGKRRVVRPLRPAVLLDSELCVAQADQPAPEHRHVIGLVPVEDDLATGNDVLLVQQSLDLDLVDALQPRGGKGDSSRDVTASRLARQSPAVVGGQRPDVDDRQVRVRESTCSSAVETTDEDSPSRHLRPISFQSKATSKFEAARSSDDRMSSVVERARARDPHVPHPRRSARRVRTVV